jgi:hypothetical protein
MKPYFIVKILRFTKFRKFVKLYLKLYNKYKMTSISCKFCNSVFSSVSALNNHKNTAKYCLKIQNIDFDKKFKCKNCNKALSTKHRLESHILVCKKEESKFTDKDIIIAELKAIIDNQEKQFRKLENNYKKQITELQDKLERMCVKAIERPTITNNTTNNTINNKLELNTFITQEYVNDKIESKFTDSYIYNKMKGVAKFVYDHIITLEDGRLIYACYDMSRKIFKYKDTNGNEVKDIEAKKLIKLIKPGLLNRSGELIKYFINHCEIIRDKIRYDNTNDSDDEDINLLKEELKGMEYLRDRAIEISGEINDMDQTNLFSKELAIITT